jgi:hypothetical protein
MYFVLYCFALRAVSSAFVKSLARLFRLSIIHILI